MTADRGAEPTAEDQKHPWVLEAVAVVLLIISTALAGLLQASSVKSLAELIGAMLGPALFTLLIIGLVRLFRGARTRRGAAQLAVVSLSLSAVGQCGSLSRQARPEVSQDKLQAQRTAAVANAVAEVSKTLPRQIDEDTELFGVAADGASIVYNYRLISMDSHDVDPEKLASVTVETLCSDPAARDKLLKQGIGIRYAFHDKTGAIIIAVPVSINSCRVREAAQQRDEADEP